MWHRQAVASGKANSQIKVTLFGVHENKTIWFLFSRTIESDELKVNMWPWYTLVTTKMSSSNTSGSESGARKWMDVGAFAWERCITALVAGGRYNSRTCLLQYCTRFLSVLIFCRGGVQIARKHGRSPANSIFFPAARLQSHAAAEARLRMAAALRAAPPPLPDWYSHSG